MSIVTTTPILSFSEHIKNKNILITVVIGNLFNQKGDFVIPTNTTFDTTHENDFISHTSIQGQLYKIEYDKISHLDQEIDNQLQNNTVFKTHNRLSSKNNQYKIGTVIKLNHRSDHKSYWVGIADVNEHGKPDGKFENLQIALESLWHFISEKGHMTRLVMPVIGSGKTGINETHFKLLQEIIFSFVAFSKEKKITEELVICINPQDVFKNKIDMLDLKKYLNFQCRFRYDTDSRLSTSKELN